MTERCSIQEHGFYGKYSSIEGAGSTIISFTDDNVDDLIAKSAVKWLNSIHVNALAVSPEKQDKGCHSFPLERIESAVRYLRAKGHT